MAVEMNLKTGCFSTLTVISKSTVLITTVRRCVLHWAFEMLERLEGKLSRAVLKGGDGGNAVSLPDHGALALGTAQVLRLKRPLRLRRRR